MSDSQSALSAQAGTATWVRRMDFSFSMISASDFAVAKGKSSSHIILRQTC